MINIVHDVHVICTIEYFRTTDIKIRLLDNYAPITPGYMYIYSLY